MFLPTAYCGGFLLDSVNRLFSEFQFAESGQSDRYLGLVEEYVFLVGQFAARTAGQAKRGMRAPKVQVLQARALMRAFKSAMRAAVAVSPSRLTAMTSAEFVREVVSRIEIHLEPAFDQVLAVLSDDYLEAAPETVGLGQYDRGHDIYAELVRLQTTLDLTPDEVHQRGLARMAEIEAAMRVIRTELGFKGDGIAFIDYLSRDPRWRADNVEAVIAVFQRYIDRLKPRFNEYFWTGPKAAYGTAPLPTALQGAMTFGYYDAPRPGRALGLYLFNSKNMTNRALFDVGSLTYHELVPGHHLHLAAQQENSLLHPFRVHNFVNAYNEGWAEYAATLAGEIGMYQEPEERYGRLVWDAFFTCRLVVDTGMNALGWPLERAQDYMRNHSGMTEVEILSESLRYSCDIPGQSLAYKLGDKEILAMRERMSKTLGARFNLKDFHAAVLESGGLPLPDLSWHLEHETRRFLGLT